MWSSGVSGARAGRRWRAAWHAGSKHCQRCGDIFALPELLRIKAHIAKAGGDDGAAENLLLESLALSEQQDSRAWSLRAAMDLARHWRMQGRTFEAAALLQAYRSRVAEGADTKDVRAMQALWAECAALPADSA